MASVRGHGTRSSHHGNASHHHVHDNNNNKAGGAAKIDSPVVPLQQPPYSDSFGSLESCGPLSPQSGDGNSGAALRGGEESPPPPPLPGEAQENSQTSTSSESDNQHSPWGGFIRFMTKPVRLQSYSKSSAAKKEKNIKNRRGRSEVAPSIDADFCRFKATWKNFPLTDLQKATKNFSQENLIGQGGYAEVYKGELQDGQFVAIKKLTKGSAEEMTVDYLSELGIIAHVDHPNIAKLIGYGVEGGMHLVLQLSPHGSLYSLLYGPKEKLSWHIRFKVAVGTAKGLIYLHEGGQKRIIHKDIKSANILLTEDFDAQIADFGLAKWLPHQVTHLVVSHVEGTIGYLPPEFFMHGIVDEKTDVFAYGVLLLELITGKPAIDSSQKSVVMWAKPLIQQHKMMELVDPALGDDYDPEQLELLILTASLCTHHSPTERPLMKEALQMLEGDPETLEIMRERQNLLIPRAFTSLLDDEDDDQDYNSTEYLNETSHQLETPLEESSDKDETLDDEDGGSETQQVHSEKSREKRETE